MKITQNELAEILRKHRLWLDDEDGGDHAVLSRADLRGADLRGANLRGANLNDAVLSGADLNKAIGIIRLPVGDPRGYDCVAVDHGQRGWMIDAGCRWGTIEEAREHLGEGYEGDREIGDRYIAALDWLEKKIAKGKTE